MTFEKYIIIKIWKVNILWYQYFWEEPVDIVSHLKVYHH